MLKNEEEVTPLLSLIKSKSAQEEKESVKQQIKINEDETDEIILLLDFFERETQN